MSRTFVSAALVSAALVLAARTAAAAPPVFVAGSAQERARVKETMAPGEPLIRNGGAFTIARLKLNGDDRPDYLVRFDCDGAVCQLRVLIDDGPGVLSISHRDHGEVVDVRSAGGIDEIEIVRKRFLTVPTDRERCGWTGKTVRCRKP